RRRATRSGVGMGSDPLSRNCLVERPMIPDHLRTLFWDVNLETFDPHQFPEYTIFRILEFGDRPEIAWLRGNFSEDQIKDVIRNERRLSPRSANFWALVYGIPFEEIAALRERERGPGQAYD